MCSIEKAVLKKFALFTGKHLTLFFNRVAGLKAKLLRNQKIKLLFMWMQFFFFNKLTRGFLCFIQTCEKLRHGSSQDRFTLKEFETTTWDIGLIIFQLLAVNGKWLTIKKGPLKMQNQRDYWISRKYVNWFHGT